MSELSPLDQALLATVAQIDVMDLSGRIIANPRRARVSTADALALAIVVERLQGIALEAELLVNTLGLPETGSADEMALKDHAVETQTDRVRAELAALRGDATPDKQETDNASLHS